MHVTAGKHNLKVYEGEQRRRANAIAIHKAYNSTSNDIALVLVDRPFIYTDRVSPICLPDVGDGVPLEKRCISTGWGANSSKTIYSSASALH